MTRILLIHSKNSSKSELKDTLKKLDYELMFGSPSDSIGEVALEHDISLVIWEVESPDKKINTRDLSLSDSLPLLIIAPDPNIENHAFDPGEFVTVDYLQSRSTQKTVEKKLIHLLQVRQLHLDLARANKTIDKLEKRITELNKSLNGHNEFLDLISRRDGLTGLHNRRYFNEMCKDFFSNSSKREDELSLAIVNVDYFSEINRSCGQDFGDFVLNELSARLTSLSREKDLCFRLSGEEFAILMPATSAEGAWQIGERLRITCEKKTFDNNYCSRKITISVGISSLQKHHPNSHEELINMADHALFYAKSEGRNRTKLYIPIDRDSFGTSEKNFKILQDTISRILGKTKLATLRSLQLLAQGIMEKEENDRIRQTQEFAELLGTRLGFTPTLIETFKNSISLVSSMRYLLHNDMISQNRPLNREEWDILTDFPYKATQLVEIFEYFSGEKTILRYHGERFDGSGYPEGLKGEQIPIGARVFHLVNSFAAMLSDRPYRKKLSPEEALQELAAKAGSQFDPLLVMKLIDVIEEKGILGDDVKDLENTRKIIQKSYSQ